MKKLKTLFLLICFAIPFLFVGCENLNKNTLATPTGLSVENGYIIFNTVSQAEYYTISINDLEFSLDATYSNNVEIIDNKINYNANKIFNIGESYTIKVKANAEEMKDSNYSNTISYTHQTNINKPQNLKINGTSLTWDTVKNASYYLVKIITPYDTVIYDEQGNVLEGDDSKTIAKAELTEYSFSTNSFDFSSLLTKAGKYKFYVSAVYSSGSTYISTDYTSKTEYAHILTLATPINGSVKKDNEGNLILSTVIDENANAIAISCNNVISTPVEIKNNAAITRNNNMLQVNLNKFFNGYNLNLNAATQFTFSTKACFVTNSEENFYITSAESKFLTFNNTIKLGTPTLSVEFNNNHDCYEASWQLNSINVSKFNLYVANNGDVEKYELTADITSMYLPKTFTAAFVQAEGSANYLNSTISNVVSNPTLTQSVPTISFNLSNNILTWTSVSNATYFLEYNNKIIETNQTSYAIDTTEISTNELQFKLITIVDGFIADVSETSAEYSPKLATPTIANNQGFVSSNMYLLTFTGSENAVGYYIYIKAKNAYEYVKIDRIYTTTAIDLSQYISSQGAYSDYQVKIQAVADPNSIYSDSNMSAPVQVSHVRILETPKFVEKGVEKFVSGDTTSYILKFLGVRDAETYEILINYNKLTLNSKGSSYVGMYEVDISNYLSSANNYEIKIRALPIQNSTNLKASEYNTTNYVLTQQLSSVQNIKVSENNGLYTLSFDPIDNAYAYRVRIVKLADSGYNDYLASKDLTNPFEVFQATDITNYLKEQGEYYVYVTALAPKNSFFGDSDESSSYATISKLTTLATPSNIKFENQSATSYMLSWNGDSNADYYLVSITDPNGFKYEFNVYDNTRININKYITIQGSYNVSIYSMINPTSVNAITYTSSPSGDSTDYYLYTTEKDFKRHTVYMMGNNYNFVVDDVVKLKNLLWYYYLYGIDDSLMLPMYLKPADDVSITNFIKGLYVEAKEIDASISLNPSLFTDADMFKDLCKQLISLYPGYNKLQGLTIYHEANSSIFKLYYNNALNVDKIETENRLILTTPDYANSFNYVASATRKSATGIFKIDSRSEMLVTTTEQLLHAVENNKKPKFFGNSTTARTVYENAKAVLSAIVTNNMSDVEKVTRIFDWLSYAYNLNPYATKKFNTQSLTIEDANKTEYALRKDFYLEDIFLDLLNSTKEGFDGEFYLGDKLTSSAGYSKAFSLLCAIEGINATTIYGTYTNNSKNYDHVWNKVYLSTSVDNSNKAWYAVDLTFSDNKINHTNLSSSYSIASHLYFLVSDSVISNQLSVVENTSAISANYTNEHKAELSYNYYANSSFGLTKEQLAAVSLELDGYSAFEYSKEFSTIVTYQKYAHTDYGEMQAFILNLLIYAKHNQINNATSLCSVEFSFNWEDNASSTTLSTNLLQFIKTIRDSSTKYSFFINPVDAFEIADNTTSSTKVIVVFN